MESLVCLYMLLCTIFQDYPDDESVCRAQPPKFTAQLVVYVFIPFYLGRIFAYFFCKKPKMVILHVVFGFLLNQIAAGVWEVLAFYRLFQLNGCRFSIAYFNLIFYFLYMIHTVLSWFLIPLFAFKVYRTAASDVEAANFKIRQIARLPSQIFTTNLFASQKSCAICMDDFTEDKINPRQAS